MSAVHNDTSFIAEALPIFISEAQEQIENLEQLLLQLEDNPGDRELLDALFRCAHTVKGSAGVFGLDRVVAFTHHVETLLDGLREGRQTLTPELGTLLLRSNDTIRRLVGAATQEQPETDDERSIREALVKDLKQACCTEEPAKRAAAPAGAFLPILPAVSSRWKISLKFGADTFRNGMDPLAIIGFVRGLGNVTHIGCDEEAVPAIEDCDPETCYLGFELELDTSAPLAEIEAAFAFVRDDCVLHIEPALAECAMVRSHPAADAVAQDAGNRADGRTRESAVVPPQSDDNRFIRVQADRLDEVINLLGELVIAGAGASMLARATRQRTLIESTQHITRLIEGIRNNTLQLRMVPIGDTFARFRRVVRDTASELGKDVSLAIVGGDTELDKAMVERIADPLMHLVRNALDHGLETPEQRSAVGKVPQGRLTLSACHESGSILIRIADDGRGIQRDKVLQRAWDRGLVEPGVTPADSDLFKLIFEPGFSTAEKVTNLSGRGVGMDVVRRNIEALRGSVTVSSEAGLGSSIEIRMPLTLAIIDGFLVGVGPSKFIFPLDSVVEVIENRPTATRLDGHGRSCVELRGQVLPVVDLRRLYDLGSACPERSSVVVVRSGTRRYGVMVDALLGQHQTVIKPLGLMLKSLRGVSGSSILGTGEVALIFDVTSLCRLASQSPSATPSTSPLRHQAAPSAPAARTVSQGQPS